MTNMPSSWDITHYQDVEAVNFFAEAVASGDKKRIRDTKHGLGILARDHARLSFRWNEDDNVGFTGDAAKSWTRILVEGVSVEGSARKSGVSIGVLQGDVTPSEEVSGGVCVWHSYAVGP